jgi:hypothetical protein
MTVTIDFNPQEEAWLNAQTQRQGLSPAEVIRKLVDQHIPTLNGTHEMTEEKASVISARSAAAIAFLNRKMQEDATGDPEEIRKSEEEFEELQRNLNANRDATGERRVFP